MRPTIFALGFGDGQTGKPDKRIDWILFRGLQASSIKTVTTQRDGRYPSDHFSVIADLELTAR